MSLFYNGLLQIKPGNNGVLKNNVRKYGYALYLLCNESCTLLVFVLRGRDSLINCHHSSRRGFVHPGEIISGYYIAVGRVPFLLPRTKPGNSGSTFDIREKN